MVFTQIFMDSVSRCFGVPDGASPKNTTTTKYAERPLGASSESKTHLSHLNKHGDEHDSDVQNICENDQPCHRQQPQLETTDRPICNRPVCGLDNFMSEFTSSSQQRQHSPSTHDLNNNDNSIKLDTRLLTPVNPHPSHIHSNSDSAALAQARHQAFAQPPCKHHSTASNQTTPKAKVPLDHKASIEKTRSKCSKRKLDIFRISNSTQSNSSPSPSFASRFLGDGSFPSSAMLCFANPVFDDDEEEMKLQRVDGVIQEDDETVASTLYWDAKYAHVVEKRPPLRLSSSFRVDENDDLLHIFQSGSHKSIKSIYCTNSENSSPSENMKDPRMESMADETSDNDDEDDDNESEVRIDSRTTSDDLKVMGGQKHSSKLSWQLQDDLDVISTVEEKSKQNSMDMGNLKHLGSTSTAALTPVCSSRSHTSISPELEERHQVASSLDVNGNNESRIR